MPDKPNILYVMTDQQRFDTIRALGNEQIYTPNLDRLVRRGVSFANAYSPCPVCVAARYMIRTGCEPLTTRVFSNGFAEPAAGQGATMGERCGEYLGTAMGNLGYRTFGIGKFHTTPWEEDLGYEVHLKSEELYGKPQYRQQDAYAAYIAREHPSYDFIEGLMGERTEMYYMPQMSPMPAEVTVEAWAADRAIVQIHNEEGRPYFGLVSFIGPHPPLAPPIPFNRIYDPDRMPNPLEGRREVDHMDEQIPWMNYAIWADDISPSHARALRARYWGEITYIDQCLGRILDAVEAGSEADNTLICFFPDHGDHMGDHCAWQKESFFEVSCRIPFLLSWPARLAAGQRNDSLVSLTDLFGLATAAGGQAQLRQGIDLLGVAAGRQEAGRSVLFGTYGQPGTSLFKIMVRQGEWKYIFFANGGGEQLFNLAEDPNELQQLADSKPQQVQALRGEAVRYLDNPAGEAALEGGNLRSFTFQERPQKRIYQFDRSRGVSGFPADPAEVLG